MSDEAIQVAVRVRPFASYEKERGAKCVISMNGAQTAVVDPSSGKERSFTFDYSYNSFVDRSNENHASNDLVYKQLGVGVLENAWRGFNCCLFAYGQTGAGKSYSMMGYGEDYGIIPRALREIFSRIDDAMGRAVGGGSGPENDIAEGGKTPEGKTSAATGNEDVTYHVECSMLEIYNEQIRDLFSSVPAKDRPKGGLKVRDNPRSGPFVAGLTKNAVQNYGQVEKLMELGAAARTVAATNMNATSSRAHTVFTVILTQMTTSPDTKKTMEKTSKINLIDLAGSERANATGATGDRLKEGCAINQSLSALGNVIMALAKQSESAVPGPNSDGSAKGKKKKGKKSTSKKRDVIPYRSSKLTHLLKQSLGGNSKTVMIAAVSPADVNYKETLTTLQYANRAKQIKNKAIVNEDPTEKMIRGLKDELDRLRNLLKAQQTATPEPMMLPNSKGEVSSSATAGQALSEEERRAVEQRAKEEWEKERSKEMQELMEQLRENERQMQEQAKTWEERLQETKAAADAQVQQLSNQGIYLKGVGGEEHKEKQKNTPHLLNLNEDPLMSGVVVYFLDGAEMSIGRKDAKRPQDVCLSGLSISKEHATIRRTDESDEIIIMPINEDAKVTVNGKRIAGPVPLRHNWRVIIGNNHVFRFVLPSEKRGLNQSDEVSGGNQMDDDDSKYDYAFAMREINEAAMEALTSGERAAREQAEREAKEMEAKVRALEAAMSKERRRAEEESMRQGIEFEKKQRDLEIELKKREEELRDATFEEGRGEQELELLRQEQRERRRDFERRRDRLMEKQREAEAELQSQIERAQKIQREKEAERRKRRELDRRLIETIPLINEANAIADELRKSTVFSIKLVASNSYSRSASQQSMKQRDGGSGGALRGSSLHRARASIIDSDVKIAVMFTDNSQPLTLWDYEKFESRLFLMREMYNDWTLDRDYKRLHSQYTKDKDPFWDPPEPRLIGTAVLYLDSLSFLLDIEETTPIIDFKGKQVGELTIELIALRVGSVGLVDNFDEYQLRDFVGHELEIEVRILGARGLPVIIYIS